VKEVVGCRRKERKEKKVKGTGSEIYEGRLVKVVGMAGGPTGRLAFTTLSNSCTTGA
jgi:CheY-specific phosphatase CheX